MIRLVLKSGVCATVWYPKCNAKHTRCICGIASQVPWKIGFSNDASSYKKCDRYKRNFADTIEEKMNTIFESMFRSYMQNLSQERQLELQQAI
jgi:hypothetical protein